MNNDSCVITTYAWFRPTGAARRLKRAVTALAEAGVRVEYVAVKPPEFNSPSIKVHLIKVPRLFASSDPSKRSLGFWFWYALASSVKCSLLAMREKNVRLMGFTFSAAFTLLPARILTRKPLITFVRSDELLENTIKQVSLPLRFIFRVLVSILVRYTSKFVAVHRQLGENLSEIFGEKIKEKISVLPNDLPEIKTDREKWRKEILKLTGKKEPSFIAVFTARFERRKNAELLINAWKEIPEPSILLLIGGGPYAEILKNMTVKEDMENRIFFVDWRDDASSFISGADLYIQPSLAEGMSNSLLEALAAGLPCIVSDIPVHRDVITEDELRFDVNDAKRVSYLVTRFMLDSAFKREMSEICKEISERYRFDWNARVVSEMLS